MTTDTQKTTRGARSLGAYLSPLGAWALALGTSIGWGSLVITANTYLVQAGPAGSVIGLLVGMAAMVVMARNYHYLMRSNADCGGVYAYARDIFGFDHGILTAWFLGLVYAAMFWANATSLPLFARYFVGNVFKVGLMYQLFGYDVYLGEALLSVGVIVLVGFFCMRNRRPLQALMVGLSLTFIAGIVMCLVAALAGMGSTAGSFEPSFVPETPAFSQVLSIALMSSWAFIGFESISHSTEEFAFSRDGSFKVLIGALVTSAALYICIILLSVTAHPAQYTSWLDYLRDAGTLEGLDRLPAFFAARSYLGGNGVLLLMVSLLALIFTSLIGNIVALSRLMCSLARDEVIPFSFATLNERGIPERAIRAIMLVSLVTPFLGRTAIGWIVDVTTLGATLVYGFASACAYRLARDNKDRVEEVTGAVGVVLMVLCAVLLLLPSLAQTGSMATESYFLFTVWAVLGFLIFRWLLRNDDERRFGKSVVAWIVLLSLILFTSLAWFGQITGSAMSGFAARVQDYYSGTGTSPDLAMDEATFMDVVTRSLNGSITKGITLVSALFMFSLGVMVSNFAIMRSREDESERRRVDAQIVANRDPLTGVKSKHAYNTKEAELNDLIGTDLTVEFAVVVCDVNGLKQVNDTLGHKAGDEYIRSASMMICQLFKHSPVYRTGGDEFVVVLQGADYEDRARIMSDLDAQSVAHIRSGQVVVASGLADYVDGRDQQVASVFERADALMYQRKKELKALQGLPER